MYRFGFVVLCLFMAACHGKKSATEEDNLFNYQGFSALFPTKSLPIQVSDTGLMKNRDTTVIRFKDFGKLIPDSIRAKVSDGSRIRYIAIAKNQVPKGETYFIVKAVSGAKRSAIILCFDKNSDTGVAIPFLIPDSDPMTKQTSVLDKSYSISRNVSKQKKNGVTNEGKDVYIYNSALKNFTLIMKDPLEDVKVDLINPIDTFPHRNKLSGDYLLNKKNLVSIRDGRRPGQLLAFVHIESEDGTCTGELKGDLLMTSPTSAIYRQGGDPCVMEFIFGAGTITLKEDEGCGSHRGVDCSYNGTFIRKKAQKSKHSTKINRKK